MLATLVALLGVCNDKSPSCYLWSLDGQCESNPEYMQATCPLSCRVCEHNCTDTSDDCSFWARTGECENNTAFMLRKCPTACGLCTPKCVDTHGGYESGPSANETMCEKWARQGDCEGNPDYVLKHCPVSCGVCKPKCKDLHEGCPAWSAAGECNNNTAYMLKQCPSACGVCANATEHSAVKDLASGIHLAPPNAMVFRTASNTPGGCHDVAEKAEDCAKWVENQECHTNPSFMLSNCAKSCGLCTDVCMDHHPECPGWARRDEGKECDTNKGFMLRTCPGSCGICTELQKHMESWGAIKEEL